MNIITKLVYLDFRIAFDMILHQKGLRKISCLEIKDNFFLWVNKSKIDRKCRDGKMWLYDHFKGNKRYR